MINQGRGEVHMRGKYIVVLCLAIILSSGIKVEAAVYVSGWDLVDIGKHLDYDGTSTYMNYVAAGASTWNGYKSGVIRRDSALTVKDVDIVDVNANNGWSGMTYQSPQKIELNKYYLSGASNAKRTNVATHELGHALGLAHSTTNSIMDSGIAGHTTIQSMSQNDRDSYDYAYSNY